MISREPMSTSSSSSSSSRTNSSDFGCSGGHCPRHRLPQLTNCATCQTWVDSLETMEGLTHYRHHHHHHHRPQSSPVNHNHHDHQHSHQHHRPHHQSSTFVAGYSPTATTQMGPQRAKTFTFTNSSSSSSSTTTYPFPNSSSPCNSSSTKTCKKQRHSDHTLLSSSSSSSNDLLLTKLLHHWLPRVCLYFLAIRVSYTHFPFLVLPVIWNILARSIEYIYLGLGKCRRTGDAVWHWLRDLGSRVECLSGSVSAVVIIAPLSTTAFSIFAFLFFIIYATLSNLDDEEWGRPLIIDMLFIFFF